MKKRTPLMIAVALAAAALLALAGCSPNLDREVSHYGMTLKVPGNWLQNPDENAVVSFEEDVDAHDADETQGKIIVSYRQLSDQTTDKTSPRTAAEALAAKQDSLTRTYGISLWSVDEEDVRIIDGAQVTSYEYSFVKDIAGEKRTYEFECAYVVTTDALYEIEIVGDSLNIKSIVESIEL